MKVEIKVPTMGESVSEAIISTLIVPSGSYVKADQEIIELETDKVNQVLYAPAAGELFFNVSVGQTVNVGDVIGTIDTSVQPAAGLKEPIVAKEPVKPPSIPEAPAQMASTAPGARKKTEDFVKEITTPPSKQEKPIPSTKPAVSLPEGASTRKRMSGLRRTIAQRLVEVKNTTAMLTTFNEVDMSSVMEIRAKEKDAFFQKHGVKLGFMSFFVKASVAALKEFPDVNSFIDGEDIVTMNTYDVGVAVSTDKGLFVPVIRGCDKLKFAGVESAIETYAKKAREGTIAIDDLKGGSFTITNGGVFGSLLSTPILNPPQSAILGMHSIVKRAVVVKDQIVIRPMMYLALSYDHRIIDGKEAVQFLVHIKENLEDPARLLLDL